VGVWEILGLFGSGLRERERGRERERERSNPLFYTVTLLVSTTLHVNYIYVVDQQPPSNR
jgi:hypothetical protein